MFMQQCNINYIGQQRDIRKRGDSHLYGTESYGPTWIPWRKWFHNLYKTVMKRVFWKRQSMGRDDYGLHGPFDGRIGLSPIK